MRVLPIVALGYLTLLGDVVRSKIASVDEVDHPCAADNLRETHRYFCSQDGTVICREGWREPQASTLRFGSYYLLGPCAEPICEYQGRGCAQGHCAKPGVCVCDIGWEGYFCDQCIPLPGCRYGTCQKHFECRCQKDEAGNALFSGRNCDEPVCSSCTNGKCVEPGLCRCYSGWTGPKCEACQTFPGCVHGDCNGSPNACECHPGYQGQLCDIPICRADCHPINGYCEEPGTCLCQTGFRGRSCNECDPYWECPTGGFCLEPHQCICNATIARGDTRGICNLVELNGPRFGPWSECSNPCREEEKVSLSHTPGSQIRLCRWNPEGSCGAEMRPCYGTRPWLKASQAKAQMCHYVHLEPNGTLTEAGGRSAIELEDDPLLPCSGDSDCPRGDRPFCVEQVCRAVQCVSHAHCYPDMCQNGTCTQLESCLNHSDCREASSYCIEGHCRHAMECGDDANSCPKEFPICHQGLCQACQDNLDCPADKPACSFGMCHEKCSSDQQCSFPTPRCNEQTGNCQHCLETTDCQDPLFYCVTGKCKPGCDNDQQCQASNPKLPICSLESSMCYECLNDGQCEEHHYCNGGYKCTRGCHHSYQCPLGQSCSRITGLCQDGCDGMQGQCPKGTTCRDRLCIKGCDTNFNCPQGQMCVEGDCQDRCEFHNHCPVGKVCSQDNKCLRGCFDGRSSCDKGHVCQNGTCVDGCDPEFDNCPPGQTCDETAQCVLGCNGMHSRCDHGSICLEDFCQPGCNEDSACPINQYCRSGQCVDGCDADDNCALEHTCSMPIRDCTESCLENDDRCPLSYICVGRGVQSQCQPGCNGTERCEQGYKCEGEPGKCVLGCEETCPEGYRCLAEKCERHCTDDGHHRCFEAEHCSEDGFCRVDNAE